MTDAFFVTCKDAGKHAFLLGPFTTEKACQEYAYGEKSDEVVRACMNIDRRAHFFGSGMAVIHDFVPGERIGLLNKNWPEKWGGALS